MSYAESLSSWASGSPFFAVGLAILLIGVLVVVVVFAREKVNGCQHGGVRSLGNGWHVCEDCDEVLADEDLPAGDQR